MNPTTDIEKRTLTLQRTLKAPIALVWDAWTKPEHIAKWWAPRGMETTIVKHQFHVGGEWAYSMMMPNGQEFLSEGVYKEIEQPVKIISSADFKPMTEGVELQTLLEAAGDQTLFTFNVVHPTEAYAKQQEEMGFFNGWGSVFDGMEKFLAEVQS